MNRTRLVCLAGGVAVCTLTVAYPAWAEAPAHHVVRQAQLTWAPGPPGLPAGGEVTVLAGNPAEPGPFTVRGRFPAGYRIPPHWHPTEENLTILSGTLAVGMGDTFDTAAMQDLAPGDFVHMAPNMRHYLLARTAVTMQVHGVGPFAIVYVNPADDPRPKGDR